ncbi:transposase [Verrucomicrobium spinosum]|uniref:transposase n=1 Tax=Verrucomicrobium spinosum TaxID=2736 RepID=UPI0001745DAD|nr:transposase [Verrucomicrobium spinosum]
MDSPDKPVPNPDESRVYYSELVPTEVLSGNLPHWRQASTTYFITFRLADALPQDKLHQWHLDREDWLKRHPEPHDKLTRQEYYDRFPRRLQRWLDANSGSCLLSHQPAKDSASQTIRHFAGARYELDEYVVASNHVHAILTPNPEHDLSKILHSWKSYSAHRLNKIIDDHLPGLRSHFPNRRVWQRESFDHIVRSRASLERIRNYIREHPEYVGSNRQLSEGTNT